MTEERTMMTEKLAYAKEIAVKPSTQLDNYLAESKGNNEHIVKSLLHLKESFSIFDNIANKLNADSYFKNQKQLTNEKKEGGEIKPPFRAGLLGELDGLVASQISIISLIENIDNEIGNITHFFADHI